MKKLFSLFLIGILLLAMALPVFAADTAKAADMRLAKTEGTVKVKNAAGIAKKVKDDMRLYSGYVISTDKKSYAYISLDKSKAVKVDAQSSVKIKKSGKKLEVTVQEGKLLFDVSEPLEKTETLNIRTSTMVTGIRGTIGIASTESADRSSVMLLEGEVAINSCNGEELSLKAGQTLTLEAHGADDTGAAGTAQFNTITEGDIPGFAAVEMKKDGTLAERIAEGSELDAGSVAATAEERLAEDEAAADEVPEDKAPAENRDAESVIFEDETEQEPAEPTEPEQPAMYSISFAGGINCDITSEDSIRVESGEPYVFSVVFDGEAIKNGFITVTAVPTAEADGTVTADEYTEIPVTMQEENGTSGVYRIESVTQDLTILIYYTENIA